MATISNDCMVLNIHTGVWLGHRHDKDATKTITEQSNAETDAARVNKHLIATKYLQPITTMASSIRHHFHKNTLPWKDNGDRLLVRQRYMQFMQEHGELSRKFDQAVDNFVTVDYPAAVTQAEFRMGSMFKPEEYPSAEELRSKFYVRLDIDSVTEAGDFRVEMDKTTLDGVRRNIEDALQQRLTRAMNDVWSRLANTLKSFAECTASDGALKKATVDNLEAIVELLPDLNIVNDPKLEQIRQEIKAALTGHDVVVLRKNKPMRQAAALEAKRIMDDMSGFMNAFGGVNGTR